MARSGDDVATGDGLGAFGAALILPVRMHCKPGKTAAGQWIQAKRSHLPAGLNIHQGNDQIWPRTINRPHSRARRALQSGPSLIHSSRHRSLAAPQPRAWPAAPCPTTAAAEGGGGRLTSATAQPWQVRDGRRRPEQLVSAARCQRPLDRGGKSSVDRVSEAHVGF
jgi:hypothetical protein